MNRFHAVGVVMRTTPRLSVDIDDFLFVVRVDQLYLGEKPPIQMLWVKCS